MAFEINNDKVLILDGAMGTMLQKRGLKTGEIPELLNFTAPDIIEEIHTEYLVAGADIILTNSFGANRFKAKKIGRSVEEIVVASVNIAKKAIAGRKDKFIALDVAPCGKVLAPAGDLSFEDAVDIFAEIVTAGEKAGADYIHFETFTDLYELKAAIIAAKENSKLPIVATMSFEENGNTFFGATVKSMVITLEALGVVALGVNCSLGPKQLSSIVNELLEFSSVPVFIKPNAGLPIIRGEEIQYDITAEEFASYMKDYALLGVRAVGGCCGTNPEYIKLLKKDLSKIKPKPISFKNFTAICSPSKQVFFGKDIALIGERLNPTGRKTLQAAIREGNIDFILKDAIKQQEQGANLLDVNMGLPDIDEPHMLSKVVKEIQAILDLPLQIDSSNYDALESAARIYNGKPIINSVNAKKESLDKILPIVKKYGCAILGLTLDDSGIPETAEERVAIAEKIINTAKKLGIPSKDILIDCLVMTASAQQKQASETLKAVRLVKEKLKVKTVLGVSNVSFGLPNRPLLNRTMLAMALTQGLDAPIMNPGDIDMSETVAAFRTLTAKDNNSEQYINKFSEQAPKNNKIEQNESLPLPYAITHGLKKEAEEATKSLLEKKKPLDIIENVIIPALNLVGENYENNNIFLPQLIKSAEAAKSSFELLRSVLSKNDSLAITQRKKIVLATVHGDIHDIGKNIVKIIMENYNFDVIDLGKDVPPETVLQAVKTSGTSIVGLSALMTTTVASMKKTIELLRSECPAVKIIVGGAVLSPYLANHVGADCYAKDAMEGVRAAEKF